MDGFEPEEFPVELEKILRKRREYKISEPTRFQNFAHYAKHLAPLVIVFELIRNLAIIIEGAQALFSFLF
ncbi:hypothetical protein [Parvularcula sp. IMCC14364]|uniref:hypothetical protein n=1 Tax=Parvularcula sp. IMCC14364 TaxID=3067902 RepID=UPI002742693A|nr:hypothetical protein [Parvularcula sp. IMCC14364]